MKKLTELLLSLGINHSELETLIQQHALQNAKDESNVLVLGDLHANTLGYLLYLALNKIVYIPEEALQQLQKLNENTYIDQWRMATDKLQMLLNENPKSAPKLVMQKNLIATLEKRINEDNLVFKGILGSIAPTLSHIQVLRNTARVLNIGDDVADRANSDLPMLQLNNFLKAAGIDIQTLLSNHGLELLYAYLTDSWDDENSSFSGMGPYHTRSLVNLKALLKIGVITKEELLPLVKSWVESIRPLSCSYTNSSETEEASFTLYRHALVGLETPKALVEQYYQDITYDDSTPEAHAKTIVAIGEKFQQSLQTLPELKQSLFNILAKYNLQRDEENTSFTINDIEQIIRKHLDQTQGELETLLETVHNSFLYQITKELKKFKELCPGMDVSHCIHTKSQKEILPFLNLAWNRDNSPDLVDLPPVHPNGYRLYASNGHDHDHQELKHNIELDQNFGKPYDPTLATYVIDPKLFCFQLKKTNNFSVILYSYESDTVRLYNKKDAQLEEDEENAPNHIFFGSIQVDSHEITPEMEADSGKMIDFIIGKMPLTFINVIQSDYNEDKTVYLNVTGEHFPSMRLAPPVVKNLVSDESSTFTPAFPKKPSNVRFSLKLPTTFKQSIATPEPEDHISPDSIAHLS